MCAAFILALSPVTADAKITISGTATVSAVLMTGSNSDDVPEDGYVSLAAVVIDTLNCEPLVPPVTIPILDVRAFGSQINLALLKEQNTGGMIGVCLEFVPQSTYWRVVGFECPGPWHDKPMPICRDCQ